LSETRRDSDARAAAFRRRRAVRLTLLLVALAAVAGVGLFAGTSSPTGPGGAVESDAPAPEGSAPADVACDGERPPKADSQTYENPPPMSLQDGVDYRAVITTSCGAIELDLLEEESPQTVNNFVFLAEEGFYDGLTFHRVEQNSVIQGGDPEGTGRGGAGYTIPDELPKDPKGYLFGTIAMANEGPDTGSSQFFIVVHDPDPDPEEIFEACEATDDVCGERQRAAEKDARVDEPAGYRPNYSIFGRIDPDDESAATLIEISSLQTKLGDDPVTATTPVSTVYIESVEIQEG
jgi:cyclophilin family peptidyl-prolyl cis-trans isomerase